MKNKTLKKIIIKTRRAVFSDIIGDNTTFLKGEGYDFVELRKYEVGEDVKKIDWTISAKMQTPYVKVFHAQRELNISIVSILGGSVHFGTHKFKQELIAEICAILGYSSIKQGDNFNSFIVNDSVNLSTKKSKKFFTVSLMLEKILNYNVLQKQVDYTVITQKLFKMINKKSIIFLIGDFFDTSLLDLKILSKKHEIIAIIVRDKFEESPQNLGNVNLIDPQTSQSFVGSMDRSLIKKYIKKVSLNDHHLYEHFQKCGIRFTKIYTSEEAITKLMPLMSGK
ncbi:hypothetical protein MNB_ARC-1_113 [hydrothermal vent metagenome]|uniref:DUF58 domain-containing protein n=1 Tax=hydrothermal vent metagenome TaxID=652676 RepID=A0A3B1DXU2_9ZZZZ